MTANPVKIIGWCHSKGRDHGRKKVEDFSKTTMWKKSIAAEKERTNSLVGKTSLIVLTLGAAVAVLAGVYFFL